MRWNILYRGSLSSCNYACDYCPFAKTKNTKAELQKDQQELFRFKDWVIGRTENIGILMTPWGEGLIRKYYQKAMTELSHAQNIYRVAIQTNLSCELAWMNDVNKKTFALWTTFHPSQISLEKFVAKCSQLDQMGIRYSVGFVGFKQDFEVLQELRKRLDKNVYLWVNAYKREENYYHQQDIEFLKSIDSLFEWNTQYHKSFGKACKAGYSTFSVDGEGNMTRCHFIKQKIGNIYDSNMDRYLQRTPCSNQTCGCHIGYIHMDEYQLNNVYEDGILERIPIAYSEKLF